MLRFILLLSLTTALHAQAIVRPIDLPAGGAETALVRFYTCGRSDAQAKGIAVVDDAGNAVPYRVLLHDPQGETVLALAPGGARTLSLRYDVKPDAAAVQRDDLPVSLVLRTWAMKAKPAKIDSVLEIGRQATRARPDGVTQVPAIHLAHNPFGPATYFYSEFEGLLRLERSMTLSLLSFGDDASAVEIDGQVVIEQNQPIRSRRSEDLAPLAKDVELSAGNHRVRYRHVQLDGSSYMVLAQVRAGRALPLPASLFARTPTATLRPAREGLGIDARPIDRLAHEQYNYHRYELAAIAPAPAGTEYRWTFSDGVKARGATVQHVLLAPADSSPTWSVRLDLVRSERVESSAAAQLRPMEMGDYANIGDTARVESYAQLIADRDYTDTPPATLEALYTLVSTTEQARWMSPLLEALLARGGRNPELHPRRYLLATFVAGRDPKRARELFETVATGAEDPWLSARAGAEALDLMMFRLGQREVVEKRARELMSGKQGRERALLTVRIGDAQRLSGRLDLAEQTYRTAQRAMQRQSDALRAAVVERGLRETALGYLAQKRYPALRELLLEWEAQFPLSKLGGDLALLTARYCQEIGDHARAAEELELLVDQMPLHPGRPELLYRLAQSLTTLGRSQEAKLYTDELRRKYPKNPFAQSIGRE